ncbi:MAG: acyl-[acyl-carrier-protein] thioesterase [Leptospiraceae bacterium]|nr:acyl-[acyl-carrier-protein] thioesterase [Leptospiraceae bacterium]
MFESTIYLETKTFDLDWNRHVTSRTYERFSLEGRYDVLQKLGYPIEKCIEEGILLVPEFCEVRFLNQQYSGKKIKVITKLILIDKTRIFWEHKLFGEDEKIACDLHLITGIENNKSEKLELFNNFPIEERVFKEHIKFFANSCERLENDFKILFSDMNVFWAYSPESYWKIFEEGRWLFFNSVVDLQYFSTLDTTSFFMGGQIKIFKQFTPGISLKLFSWIEKIEKIRFYFRQDIIDNEGNIYASMRDEQLFVSVSASRPKKAIPEFLEVTKKYTEYA